MNLKKGPFILVLLLYIFIIASLLNADEIPNSENINKEIFNNVSEEYATCAAFYTISSEAFRRSGSLKTAKEFEEIRDAALQYSLISSKEGRTDEMAGKVTLARYELNVKSMTEEMDNDLGNIAILLNKYADRCKSIMDSPDETIEYWTENILIKYNLK